MCGVRYTGRHERGAALVAVLVAVALLLPLGALAVMQARIGLLTQQSLRGDVEALHAAEAALACAVSRIDAGMDFALLPLGPDGKSGTGDDGKPPFALECGITLAGDVRLEAGAAQTLVLVATGRGTRGATRVVERRVHRVASDAIEIGGWRER